MCASPGFALLVFAAVIAAQRALRACAWSFDHLFKEELGFFFMRYGGDCSRAKRSRSTSGGKVLTGGKFTTRPNFTGSHESVSYVVLARGEK